MMRTLADNYWNQSKKTALPSRLGERGVEPSFADCKIFICWPRPTCTSQRVESLRISADSHMSRFLPAETPTFQIRLCYPPHMLGLVSECREPYGGQNCRTYPLDLLSFCDTGNLCTTRMFLWVAPPIPFAT